MPKNDFSLSDIKMDSVKPSTVTSNVSGLVRSFAKALRFKVEGAAADHKDRRRRSSKTKFQEKPTNGSALGVNGSQSFHDDVDEDEKLRIKASNEALLSKLFASISSVKAAYAQLQTSQSPYDPEGIQSADEMIINELKCLSEFKQRFVKKTIDPSPGVTQLQAEIQEQQSLLKTFEIMGRKFESQLKLQDSEITFLREKLEDCDEQNRSLEKRFHPGGSLSILEEDLHFTGLNPNHFITVLRYTIKSIRSFTRFMIDEMESSRWDIDAAASSIEPGSVYRKPNHISFVFESFVCRVMFDGFQYQNFGISNHSMKDKEQQRLHFFQKFNELKSKNPEELMARKLNSTFGRFFRAKYFQVVHPKMELSFFGDLTQRNLINSGKFPDTKFCYTFGEMAKRVWLLHCLAFSFDPEASIFQVRKGCRFSEVYMENVVENPFNDPPIIDPRVCFTVVPGFKIGKTAIQSLVYLSPA